MRGVRLDDRGCYSGFDEAAAVTEEDRRWREWVRERLVAWVKTQDHYYVGYEFADGSPSFESLVDEVFQISKDTL